MRALNIATLFCDRWATVPILFLCASSIAAVSISGVSSPRLKNLMPSMLLAAAQRTHSRAFSGDRTGPPSQHEPSVWELKMRGATISFFAERFFSELLSAADDNETPRTVVTPCASHSLYE